MSYLDFFCNNIKKDLNENKELIRGTCYSMCPQDEVNLRTKEKLIHVLEVTGSGRKLVKGYSRSAADSNMVVPRLLRPYSVLKETLPYLLFQILKRTDVPTSVLYDFVNDRLRAIRQDMTIQRLPSNECACLLEPMIRFYVFFAYKLYDRPLNEFDPVLNKKYLLECMKWFLYCCDTMEQQADDSKEDLNVFLTRLNINQENLICDKVLIESLYILCNLFDIHPLIRYLKLPKDVKSDKALQLAYRIAVANMKGDYINVCRLIDQLCPLTYYAACLHLPEVQKRALRIMSHAYNSKQLTVPGALLQEWLHFSSLDDVVAACRHYGLQTRGDRVNFSKADFKDDVPLHRHVRYLPSMKQLGVEDIFTYFTNSIS